MSIINGHNLRVYIGVTALAKATECSYSLSTSMREVAHKDTAGAEGGFREVKPGQKSGSMSSSALYAEGDSYDTLFDAWTNGTEMSLRFSDDVTGNKSLSTKGYITSLEMNASDNENVTYSVSWDLSELPTRVTN